MTDNAAKSASLEKLSFENALKELGRNNYTMDLIRGYALLLAFKYNHTEKAKEELNNALKQSRARDTELAKCKITLADIYVKEDNIWEAALLYGQVNHDFKEDVIGQALTQRTNQGGWWDIFWKDSPLTGESYTNMDENTIIHEIGHTLGLSHPFNDPKDKMYTSTDTIMSYNRGENGWDTWFSRNDLNALIKIWGRENDQGYINYENMSKDYKYKRNKDNTFSIKTEIGYEDISDVETLKFTDKSIDVLDDVVSVFDLITGLEDITGKIYRLYNAAFARFPDKEGFKYWIDKNISLKDSLQDTARSFIISKEFLTTYGQDSSNRQFVSYLYSNVLDRSPDMEGYNYWLNQLDSGYETRDDLLLGFSESIENKSLFSMETNIF